MTAVDNIRRYADDIGEWVDADPDLTILEIVTAQRELRKLVDQWDAQVARRAVAA